MSVNEVLNVMSAFRRGNSIMPPAAAQRLLDDNFGLDRIHTPGPGIYSRTGYWQRKADDKSLQMEQAVALFLPEAIELAIFANSPVVVPPRSKYLIFTVFDIYKKHVSFR